MQDRKKRNWQLPGAAAAAGVVGLGAGAATSDATWADHLVDVLKEVLDEHGLAVALVGILVPAALWLVYFLLKATLERSDDEIERLVDERNRLWDVVLEKRPTSTTTPKVGGKVARKPAKRPPRKEP